MKATKERRKTRPIRCNDSEWADFLLVKPRRVRQLVAKEAAKLRMKIAPNLEE